MPREAKVLDAVLTPNAPTDVVTVPPGHKYELTGISFNGDASTSVEFLLLRNSAGGYFGRDQVSLATGRFTVRTNYELMTFVAGDTITVYALATGAPAVSCVLDYIDVAFA